MQTRFLRAVGFYEEEALVNFRLAPLCMRRGIAILGFLHRVVLGLTSTQVAQLFPMAAPSSIVSDQISAHVRGLARRQNKQIADKVTSPSSEQFKRSIFGMVQCYNALLQFSVDAQTVSRFQSRLQRAVMSQINTGQCANWQHIFRDCRRYGSLLRFQLFFL